MPLSMFDLSAPRFVATLRALDAILAKAEAHAAAKKIEPAALVGARLFPDMLPLARQIQIASDQAKGACARLAGVELPKYEDNEQTFAELHERIAKTVAFVESFQPGQIDGSEEKPITLKVGGSDRTFTGHSYLVGFVWPNFYFHVVTAYNILRHNGVEIGKRDYLPLP
jgi:uncharacterized protein